MAECLASSVHVLAMPMDMVDATNCILYYSYIYIYIVLFRAERGSGDLLVQVEFFFFNMY